jgi:hypothetical protein
MMNDYTDSGKRLKLVAFLQDLDVTSMKLSRRACGSGISYRLWKQRRSIFGLPSPLYSTMMCESDMKGLQRSLSVVACQTACLTYLGISLLDQAENPHVEQCFLEAMESLSRGELARGHSPEHLLARLLMGIAAEQADFSGERARKVMSVMLEVKELDTLASATLRLKLWEYVSLERKEGG